VGLDLNALEEEMTACRPNLHTQPEPRSEEKRTFHPLLHRFANVKILFV
jgi:metal-dependent amidase/aminoacylase/carboxypeptidase family protein